MRRTVSAALLALLLAPPLPAADWPQFLGPDRDNTSPEAVAAWTGELKVLWRKPVGAAHSSPVVAGGVVFSFDQPQGKNADRLIAFDAKTGDVRWEKSYERDAFSPPFGEGPRGTPSVVDGKVYTLGGTGILACWDAKTGEVAWKIDTLKQFMASNLTFGVSASPLVHAGKVFVNVGGKGAGMVAFNAKDGTVAWQAADDGASYSSPIAATAGGVGQVVFLTGAGLVGVTPDAGEVLWRHPFKDLLQESATTPLMAGNLLVGSSVTLGSVALRFPAAGGKPAAEPAWRKPALNCYFSTPVPVGDDTLYMLNGKLSIRPTLTLRCVDRATGDVKWEKPNVGKYHAALVRTGDGKLLMLDDNGRLTLFAHDRGGYKELARSKVCGATWAHPALSGGVVYVRDEKDLVAVRLGD